VTKEHLMEAYFARIVGARQLAGRNASVAITIASVKRAALRFCHRFVLLILLLGVFPVSLVAEPRPTATPTPTPEPAVSGDAVIPASDADALQEEAGSTGGSREAAAAQPEETGGGGATRVDVCGSITTDTTWTSSNLYVVTCVVTIQAGVTLRIEPGTVVKVMMREFFIDGTLVAEGTAGSPVVFTSFEDDAYGGDTNGDGPSQGQPGQWTALTFQNGGVGRLTHVIVQYAGGYYFHYGTQALVRSFGGDVVLDQVTLRRSGLFGLYATNAVSVTRSHITDNIDYGLFYDGLGNGAPLQIVDNVFSGPASGQLRFDGEPGPVTVQGNRIEGAARGFSVRGVLRSSFAWDNDPSFVMTVSSNLEVAATGSMSIAPGSVVKLTFGGSNGGELIINGELDAVGTKDAPVVFTSLQDDEYGGDTNGDGASTTGQPGQWSAITFNTGSHGRIAHAIIRYGGGYHFHYGSKALIRNSSDDVTLDGVELTRSLVYGVYAENGPMVLRNCKITDNGEHGIFNYTPKFVVDARRNWWGDASGPLHTKKNPSGKGDQVSDGVLFFPWAVDENGTVPTQVTVEGPSRVSPGQTVEYAVSYYAGEAIEDAILVFLPPASSEYLPDGGGAIEWPERHEVFWRLGNLPADASGTVSARVQFAWGLPSGAGDLASARIGGTNVQGLFEPAPYLAYAPTTILSTEALGEAQLTAELDAYPELRELHTRALSQGYVVVDARSVVTDAGAPFTQIVLMDAERRAVKLLRRQGSMVEASTLEPSRYIIEDVRGSMAIDLQTFSAEFFGEWKPDGAGGADFPPPGFYACLAECAFKKIPVWLILNHIKRLKNIWSLYNCLRCAATGEPYVCTRCGNAIANLMVNLPMIREFLDLSECVERCGKNPNAESCTQGIYQCLPKTWLAEKIGWGDNVKYTACILGRLSPVSLVYNCAVDNEGNPTQRCVEGVGCQPCGSGNSPRLRFADASFQAEGAGMGACADRDTMIWIARDPNAKQGPVGDVIPGQEVTYTVEYENVGEGSAYSVYVTDELSPHLDETSLDLQGEGEFVPATRSIVWEIGELAPKGQEGSKGERTFNINLKSGLPSGTVITNQAIVYFPSVPEETATNTVVNVLQPLAAMPQSLQTPYGTPIGITLSGRDMSGSPLTYTITEQPLAGDLTGTPPDLTYIPTQNFTGQDRFTFTVSNGVSTSRTADVTIVVTPSSADTIRPEVMWTYPESGAAIEEVQAEPVGSDDTGLLYAPSLLAGFSEAMDPNTITGTTLRVVAAGGRTVTASASWDGTSNQAVLVPREAWQDGSYTATVTTGARDASGNTLAADYSWSFRIGAAPACAGDCNGDGRVRSNEVTVMINIINGKAQLTSCPAADANGDGRVRSNEVTIAINNINRGCPAAAGN
jgi:hypothetical protein